MSRAGICCFGPALLTYTRTITAGSGSGEYSYESKCRTLAVVTLLSLLVLYHRLRLAVSCTENILRRRLITLPSNRPGVRVTLIW